MICRLRHVGACLQAMLGLAVSAAEPAIDFARDIQPILANRCYDCHGREKAKGGLRLISLKDALKGGESGERIIVAGQSAKSALIQRITSADDDEVMPQKGERLTPAQIDLLKRWIDAGAVWPDSAQHWAYVKPTRPAVPVVAPTENRKSKIENPIDAFIRARLAKEGLSPSPELDKPRWLRRVSLDLIGLPPTPKEIDDFLADPSAHAHERVVDRLLSSPQYGERWARPWLDLARYADSHGFQRDDLRDLWPYRDWVIRALNADMPFDQFTIWQIAGDLLPETQGPQPNYDALIATGFHRAAPTNVEAGTDQEEGRINQVFDRVNTTAAVWLGSTLECAQCHNHKYDPFTQKDYYELFAFFNNTPRETAFATAKAMATLKFTGPYLDLPDAKRTARESELKARLKQIDEQLEAERQRLAPERAAWETAQLATLDSAGQTRPLDIADFESVGGSTYKILPDHSVLLTDDAPDQDTYVVKVHTNLTGITGFKLEALTDPSLPGNGPGRGDAARPNFILNSFRVTMAKSTGTAEPVTLVRASASYSQSKFGVENALKPKPENRIGWAIGQQFHREHWAIFETEKPIGDAEGTTLTFTLVQNFGAGRTIGRLRLTALTGPLGGKTVPQDIAAILRAPPAQRTPAQDTALNEFYFSQSKSLEELKLARQKVSQELGSVTGPRTLVMRELPEPRPTSILKRGNFLDPGERVEPGTPSALHALRCGTGVSPVGSEYGRDAHATHGQDARATRLDLARWLVDRENPLVARVTVNRWWAEFFGRGLVSTLEDFGVKGEPPTHPELLDWLAVEFMEHGWSMKHIHRLIALSATYRQSSRVTPELLAHDPENRLLARGPRFRLDAETIRDNALAVAGLLSLKQGGPPVRPYQPPGLWENKVGGDRVTYDVSEGGDAHRRGIYTVWKRSSPYPSFMNFDATARTACTIKRSRSNTPLQALTLLNDPVYVEAAAALAKRIVAECATASTPERICYAFKVCLARAPDADEVAALQALFEQQTASHNGDERSAWQAVATTLLNLDEMITK